jgi:hypothetical protein
MDRISQEMIRIWEELDQLIAATESSRIYRRLNLDVENGIRLSCVCPGNIWEMLIEVGKADEKVKMAFPKWRGMNFENLILDVPVRETTHIGLVLDKNEYRDIYLTVCADLADGLENCTTDDSRRKEIADFLARWSRFFEKYGDGALSPERQRGLVGELKWLERMLRVGIEPAICIGSWKGCERGFHDFDAGGRVVEVKTTMTKEPRRVEISNERQLDDRNLSSLHLAVFSLSKMEAGESLPELVNSLRAEFAGRPSLKYAFDRALKNAGYLDIHSAQYSQKYSVKKEELFRVEEGFPRIIGAAEGVGDIRYSVVVAACQDYSCHISEYLNSIKEASGTAHA